MSALVVALIGLAGLLAERGVAQARRAGVRRSLGPVGGVGPPAVRDPRRAAVVAGAGVVGLALWGPVGGIVSILGVLGARWTARVRRSRAARGMLDEQLADAVRALAGAMRAGQSVPQALAYVAGEAEDPLASHLAALVGRLEVGVPMVEALSAWADRVATDDARLVAAALDLHRRAGGDLPSVLEQVGATIRERVAAAREVRALTAQARLSGLILGLLPVGFFAFLWVTSRRDMQAALGTPVGALAVVLGLAMEGAAFLWIRKLLAVTV